MDLREMAKQKIPSYAMKLQLYPSAAQKEIIDQFFRALHVAYNITFHHVFLKDPRVCTAPSNSNAQWPVFSKMAKSEWLTFLRAENPIVAAAPAAALPTNFGLFRNDAKRAWESSMKNAPSIRTDGVIFISTAKTNPGTAFLFRSVHETSGPLRIIPRWHGFRFPRSA